MVDQGEGAAARIRLFMGLEASSPVQSEPYEPVSKKLLMNYPALYSVEGGVVHTQVI